VKKLVNLTLGIVTSIGGFVEVGSISTAAQAGSEFGFALLWAIAVATLFLAALAEMAGRVAAVSKRSMAAAVRERFGFQFQVVPLTAELIIDLLLLTAEIGGTAIAIKMLTGIGFQWWVVPIGIVVWLVLWLGNFSVIEDGVGLLGMITLSFVVAAWRLHPDYGPVAYGFVPTVPDHDRTRYAFLAVSIVGATVSPYLLNFYSSGAVEEDWHASDLWINRLTAYFGMGFGSIVAMGCLVTAAIVLGPHHIKVDSYEQAARMFDPVYGRWAVTLFALSLGVGCFGAAVEITLNAGYVLAQIFGWTWGVEKKRRDVSRFVAAFSLVLLLAVAVAAIGFDPLQVTLISVSLTVVIMPLLVLPFLVLMNDPHYVKEHRSGSIGNGFLAALTILGALLALIVIPLEVLGG
jgi:NRAMP (natural resistance-associated macrophage protein)-like metal ion transporter